ncbi:hypothetical protein [Cupriavidus pinatubonensis]|uniref:Uncharacterized protein n=1 Tax=Cupriavidus pinatubonensis TaxID=248026 RepID=A0ABM8WTP5_9BURK|nr:hypothetical protein [Cupriavidus pinatubonensis]CAG9170828.1 hypothetical protein LMG23994_02017 [Cupriavidus pinatubonensis]
MARLDYIRYEFFDASLGEQGELVWAKQAREPIERLPQIFWADGSGWAEANIWALERAANVELSPETPKRTMKHLRRYAEFLEVEQVDWRHFPVRKDEQPLRKFRKQLLDEVDRGELALDTARNCMAAVIQFHRFGYANDLVDTAAPLWKDHVVIIPFFDSKGFKRTMTRLKSDLSISNRRRIGAVLEDGLLPLRAAHMTELLKFTAQNSVKELHIMLGTGFFTGARIGTITTMTVTCLETAREHPEVQGLYLLPVGPGTGIATKGSVSGDLLRLVRYFVSSHIVEANSREEKRQ